MGVAVAVRVPAGVRLLVAVAVGAVVGVCVLVQEGAGVTVAEALDVGTVRLGLPVAIGPCDGLVHASMLGRAAVGGLVAVGVKVGTMPRDGEGNGEVGSSAMARVGAAKPDLGGIS